MSTQYITIVRDDLDDSEGAKTRKVDAFTIDLTDENWDTLQAFIKAGRAFDPRPPRSQHDVTAATATRRASADLKAHRLAAREWLRAQGRAVSPRGVIRGDWMQEYEQHLKEPGPVAVEAPPAPPDVVFEEPKTPAKAAQKVAAKNTTAKAAAPKAAGPKVEPKRTQLTTVAATAKEKRKWWKDNGKTLGLPAYQHSGRIPAEVDEAFAASVGLVRALGKVSADEGTQQLNKVA